MDRSWVLTGSFVHCLWVQHGISTWDPAHFGHVFHKGLNWATGSFVDCFVGSTWAAHIGPSPLWPRVSQKVPIGLAVCGLNVDPFWIHVCCPPFWVSFRWPELGNNWVLCRLLCGSHMGCPRGTQLMLAKCFTKVPIGLAHVLRVRCPCCHQRANQGSPIGTSTHCQLKKRNMHCRSSQLSYIVECHIACIATSHTHPPITQ